MDKREAKRRTAYTVAVLIHSYLDREFSDNEGADAPSPEDQKRLDDAMREIMHEMERRSGCG